MSQNYPSAVYKNKLLLTNYLHSENLVPGNIIDANVEGDWLLYLYINKLDEETFYNMPEGLGELGEICWVEDRWNELMPKIADESRKHGWCVVQFYDDGWAVYTLSTFADWIKEVIEEDGSQYIKRVGAKFNITDDLGNSSVEECLFDNNDCFLVKFKEGDGRMIFAASDISDAMLDIVFNIRQVKGQMDFIGSKPGFKHIKYGVDATDENIAVLDEAIKNVDSTSAIGAPESVLGGFETVSDENIKVVIPIFDKSLSLFAGLTRLPISFYTGERTSGWGQEAEKTDLLKIDRKKNALLKRYEPIIKDIFFNHYQVTIENLEIKQDVTVQEVEENDDNK